MNETNQDQLTKEEMYVIDAIKESLSTNVSILESSFSGIPYNSFTKIFKEIRNEIDDSKFSTFVDVIKSWKSDFLVEESLKAVVLSKLQGKKESSACTIFSLTELAKSKPSQLCHNVLIPLLTDESFDFTDVELISSLYDTLPTPQKDLIILSLTKKDKIEELDWQFLDSMVKQLSSSGVINIVECVRKWSNKFTKSQVFGKFLVNLCKNLNSFNDTDTISFVIEKHETIFKRQALKYLQEKLSVKF
ncbi:hypothetical protein RUM43_004043 [Polyplax serrata]|uniref:Fanconi Anaemia group E protein C-terminal domain-containing protein n=1 Tax=Polyplax serrata TaxID=468196 RepID=A0AAN8SB27_POLSC